MAEQVESIKWVPNTRFLVDGFRFQSPRCSSYFLSHMHGDHYCGELPGHPCTCLCLSLHGCGNCKSSTATTISCYLRRTGAYTCKAARPATPVGLSSVAQALHLTRLRRAQSGVYCQQNRLCSSGA